MAKVQIEESWYDVLQAEFEKPYFNQLVHFIKKQKAQYPIYPPGNSIFNAFNATPFNRVKVVLIGQDPYHGPGQANGLSFSVKKGVSIPPSLKNIFKELESDIGVTPPQHGDLTAWSQQGVLLLNAVLTVQHKQPGSHQNKGWEQFTNAAIEALQARTGLVYFLWGNYARAKKELINIPENLVIESAHPSPFSAHRGFLGSQPFSKANQYLQAQGKSPVEWQIS